MGQKYQCVVCGSGCDKMCTGCSKVAYCKKQCQRQHWPNHKPECKPCWALAEEPSRGKFVVATRNIKAGEIVMGAEKPVVIGPHTIKPSPVCLGCFFPIHFIRDRCKHCDVPLCESRCSNSEMHQEECKLLRTSPIESGDFEDYDIITPLRVLIMKKTNPAAYKEIHCLESNLDFKKGVDLEEQKLTMMTEKLQKYLKNEDFTDEEIRTVIGILDTNTYQILVRSSPTIQDFVCGLYLRTSRLNHHCKPNTRPVFAVDRSMSVIATEDIPKDSQITTSYMEPFYTTMQRRALLRKGKCFDCDCSRCADPTELNSYSSALTCSSCKSGWVTATQPLSPSKVWQCSECKLCVSAEQVLQLESRLVQELGRVNRSNPENLEKFHAAYSGYLHPNHAFLMQLKHWMFESYGKRIQEATAVSVTSGNHEIVADWIRRAINLGEELLRYFDKLEGKFSFIRGVVMLEMCHTYLKTMMVPPNIVKITLPEVLTRVNELVKIVRVILQHEDPKGPEAGGLIMGLRQMEITISQF